MQAEREGRTTVQPQEGEASPAEELDELVKRIPKLIALLPDVLHRPRSVDDRHAAAIEEMTQSLMGAMGKAKPAMLVSLFSHSLAQRVEADEVVQLKQPLLAFMDPSTRLSLIRGKSYAGFMQRLGTVSA